MLVGSGVSGASRRVQRDGGGGDALGGHWLLVRTIGESRPEMVVELFPLTSGVAGSLASSFRGGGGCSVLFFCCAGGTVLDRLDAI